MMLPAWWREICCCSDDGNDGIQRSWRNLAFFVVALGGIAVGIAVTWLMVKGCC